MAFEKFATLHLRLIWATSWENLSSGLATRLDHRPAQLHRQVRILKFFMYYAISVSRQRTIILHVFVCWPAPLLEPPHDKTNKVACAPSKDSDQTGRILWSAWAFAQSDQSSLSAWRKLWSLATYWVHSEDSDQTGRMPKLIRVFAGRTCHFVGFVMRRLNLFIP